MTQKLLQYLQQKGFNTPAIVRTLEIELGDNIKNIERNPSENWSQGNKAQDSGRNPTHGHSSKGNLVNSAMILLYNQFLMARPVSEENLDLCTKKPSPSLDKDT